MGRFGLALLFGVALAVLACTGAPRVPPSASDMREEVIWIPATIDGRTLRLQATLFRPANAGRAPVVVINHGTQGGVPGRDQPRYRALDASRLLVASGYVVLLPMRRGYAGSEGEQVQVHGADLEAYGIDNARDVRAAVTWIRDRDFVDPRRIFVFGQSTGGLTTMAYLGMADEGVVGAVNFHGGMRPHHLDDDPLLDGRIRAFASYAKTTRLPSLWIYTDNDHSSRPPFIARLHAAYRGAGGDAELHQLPSFKRDGHGLFGDPDGRAFWVPLVDAFLQRLGGPPLKPPL